ncbi:alpha/beta hydrolase [Leptolyngbya sp. FACHB-17]|uniref:alpha/beta hydrolase n=1 Tax=unclassified Leptolyngbya TaxID=2650499 RepID=UPI0016814202|nr:alpha/beta hydrolase [Leptolyngbya sp. FACHB-17]MBD2079673.1 alpha/beta hydrolase [Leptolyngbya sp. FACHB-17]
MALNAIAIPAKSGTPKGSIVILHGWGSNAQDVAFLCSLLELPDIQFFIPDAPFPHPYSTQGKMWYDLSYANFQADFTQRSDLQTSRKALIDWLNSLEAQSGIPLSRTILGGFSQGGAMTLEVGLSLPLAGLMVLSGYQHGALNPGEKISPILMVHGRQDQVVPIAAAHRAKANLERLNASIEYREFDMGHEISPLVLNEVYAFVQKALA